MTSKLSWHSILQIVATAAQVGNVVALALQASNPKVAGVAACLVGCFQVVLHQYAYTDQPPAK